MTRNWKIFVVFVIFPFICFVFYEKEGHEWMFKRFLNFNESGGKNNTPTTTFLPETTASASRETFYEQRHNDVVKGCKKINRTVANQSIFNSSNLLYDEKHFIYYCPIPKVSSTFWKKVLLVMTSEERLNSPFKINLDEVALSKLKHFPEPDENIWKEKGTSFMFVRDPYSRLFSGYENKIYHPNLMFWKYVGRHVVRVVRGSHKKVYKNYGFDVTFPEFIKYILYQYKSEKYIDRHFSPMISQCDPCSIRFQYIGKLETIKDDARYLITKWNRSFDDFNLQFDDFDAETVLDTVRGHLYFLFQTKKILKEIRFPFIKLMLRTWRDLQIRGYLSKYIPFPFKDTDAYKITIADFANTIGKALNIQVNRTEVRLQRDEALIQAYRQVPMEDMEKLRMYLLNDCLLFGYDDRPLKLFDRTKPLVEDFLYLDGLKRN